MTGDSSSSDRGMTGDRRSSSRPASRVTEARKRGRAAGGARGLTEAFVFVHADGAVARPRSAVCGDDMAGEALHAGSHLGEEKREHALGVRVRLQPAGEVCPVNCPPAGKLCPAEPAGCWI